MFLIRREHAGFPRFRPWSRYDSFTYLQKGFRMVNGKLRLSKIDDMAAALAGGPMKKPLITTDT